MRSVFTAIVAIMLAIVIGGCGDTIVEAPPAIESPMEGTWVGESLYAYGQQWVFRDSSVVQVGYVGDKLTMSGRVYRYSNGAADPFHVLVRGDIIGDEGGFQVTLWANGTSWILFGALSPDGDKLLLRWEVKDESIEGEFFTLYRSTWDVKL